MRRSDLFTSVADQIISDLVRIAIQQTIIKPLATSLFGGGSGAEGGLGGAISGIGALFAGGFADGGLIPNGQWGIVGEEGPEAVFAGPNGLDVVSGPDTRRMLGEGAGGGGSAVVDIRLGPGLEADLLNKSAGQTVRIIQDVAPRWCRRLPTSRGAMRPAQLRQVG